MSRLLREDIIHVAVRGFLKSKGWTLIAGQFPDGSDDELAPLNITDPRLARDKSPDHRRHSLNKLVPDLIACKGNRVLIVEMKPAFSVSDENKLVDLISKRHADLVKAVGQRLVLLGHDAGRGRNWPMLIPGMGFTGSCEYSSRQDFAYFLVNGMDEVIFAGRAIGS